MANANAWEGIQRHGLLSTSALLDLYEITGPERTRIESARRPENVVIEHAIHGRAVIRDNKPMDDVGLRRSLSGATPQEWYELLNRKVFFWLSEDRVQTLLSARAYKHENHCVITIRSRDLVEHHCDRIWLCPMNSGCTKPYPHPRSPSIFHRIPDYPFEYWRNKRHVPSKAAVELAVDVGVPDIVNFVELVAVRSCCGVLREIWRG